MILDIFLHETWWNLLILCVVAIIHGLNHMLAKAKRNDDFFKIHYEWLEACVNLTDELSSIKGKFVEFEWDGGGP